MKQPGWHIKGELLLRLAVLLALAAALLLGCSISPGRYPGEPTPAGGAAAGPASGYANQAFLMEPAWLAAHLDDPNLRVVALGSQQDYLPGHVPGAIRADTPDFQLPDTDDATVQRWTADMERKMGELGLAAEDTVVIYDYGNLFAARMWWVLDYLGHKDVRLLNGGWAAWLQAGQRSSTEVVSPRPATYRASPAPERLATWKYGLDGLKDPSVVFLDVRRPEEYRGTDKSGAKRGGHIPGAVNVNYVNTALSTPPRYFKAPAELEAMYAAAGVTKDKEIIVYCASGIRASVGYFTLRLLGYPKVRNYSGSWAEWGNREDLPVE